MTRCTVLLVARRTGIGLLRRTGGHGANEQRGQARYAPTKISRACRHQNTNLRLNCSCRIGNPSRVFVIVPNAPVLGIGTPSAVTRLALSTVLGSPNTG